MADILGPTRGYTHGMGFVFKRPTLRDRFFTHTRDRFFKSLFDSISISVTFLSFVLTLASSPIPTHRSSDIGLSNVYNLLRER